jgi:hypothetical protein
MPRYLPRLRSGVWVNPHVTSGKKLVNITGTWYRLWSWGTLRRMTRTKEAGHPCHAHAVHFYTERAAMGAHVAQFLWKGFQSRESVLVVATRETQEEIRKHLVNHIPHLDTLPHYTAVDADELLSSFLVNASPDRDQFFAVMDGMFAKPSLLGRPIRVYGEMVVRLWHAGLPEAALQLEDLWNLLADRYKFSLLCAYPMNLFEGQNTQWFLQTCATHSQLSLVSRKGLS